VDDGQNHIWRGYAGKNYPLENGRIIPKRRESPSQGTPIRCGSKISPVWD